MIPSLEAYRKQLCERHGTDDPVAAAEAEEASILTEQEQRRAQNRQEIQIMRESAKLRNQQRRVQQQEEADRLASMRADPQDRVNRSFALLAELLTASGCPTHLLVGNAARTFHATGVLPEQPGYIIACLFSGSSCMCGFNVMRDRGGAHAQPDEGLRLYSVDHAAPVLELHGGTKFLLISLEGDELKHWKDATKSNAGVDVGKQEFLDDPWILKVTKRRSQLYGFSEE
ncbi:MAG: hypothetical protein WC505_06045 [Patescibacteria group bacterium]